MINPRKILPKLAALTAALLLTASAYAEELEVLFVGNSYVDYNALNKQVEAMVEAGGEEATFKRETQGGYSWQKHWDGGQAQRRIENEAEWDYVVLQNHSRSSLDRRSEFDEYGQILIDLVEESGAEPVLYMTWARQHLPEDQAIIAEAYSSLGQRNGIKVAPVGLAFEAWIDEHPDIPLHIQDRSHPTSEGSYLAACVIYATITGESPVGAPNIIEGKNWVTKGDHLAFLSPTLARQLQETAWATVQAYDPADYASDTPLTLPSETTASVESLDSAPILGSPSNIRINFGGSAEEGWNKVGGAAMSAPMALVDASGQPTQATLTVIDDFESYENPKVVGAPLSGPATAFEGASSATLFVNREKDNPSAAVELKLDPSKTYQFNVWASRAASGKRWARYTVAGQSSETKFLAAGGDYGATGNPSEILTFSNVQPTADGTVTLSLDFPKEGDPEFNVGPYVYLTGLIIADQSDSAGGSFASAGTSASQAPVPAAPTEGMEFTDSRIQVNFGGDEVPGWNKVGGSEMAAPKPLTDAAGQTSGASIQVVDDFESYENPKVVNVPLTGEAAAFDGASSATLFINREKGNPTAAVRLFLPPENTYQLRVWASRAASGKRWARYTVSGQTSETKFLAAGGDYGTDGNPSEILTFSDVRPDADGIVTLQLSFPQEGDPEFNVGPYVYLTGLIISEQP